MLRLISIKALRIGGLIITLYFYPIASWAVVALPVQPHHEYEAAFCLGLLSAVDPSISFNGKRKIQLAAESLSFAPEESMVSRKGSLAAVNFVSADNGMVALINRINTCSKELSEIIEQYVAHSCGFGIGTLATEWSAEEIHEFNQLFGGRKDLGRIDGL